MRRGAIAVAACSAAGCRARRVAVAVGGLWWYLKPLEESSEQQASTHVSGEGERRILVIANETVAGAELREAIESAASGYNAHVLVVTPALNTKLRHWVSDEDGRAPRREPGWLTVSRGSPPSWDRRPR